MADEVVPISALPPAGTITGGEYVAVVQGGQTRRSTVSEIRPSSPTLYVTGNQIGITGSNQVTIPNAGATELTTSGGTASTIIGARAFVEVIIVQGLAGASSVKVGTTVGGAEIVPLTTIADGENFVFRVDYFFASAGTIYITGPSITVLIYTR